MLKHVVNHGTSALISCQATEANEKGLLEIWLLRIDKFFKENKGGILFHAFSFPSSSLKSQEIGCSLWHSWYRKISGLSTGWLLRNQLNWPARQATCEKNLTLQFFCKRIEKLFHKETEGQIRNAQSSNVHNLVNFRNISKLEGNQILQLNHHLG